MAKTNSIKIRPDEEWRIEADLNTLMEAERIKADPKRYEKVQALAKKKMMDVAKVAADTEK